MDLMPHDLPQTISGGSPSFVLSNDMFITTNSIFVPSFRDEKRTLFSLKKMLSHMLYP